MRYEYPEWGLLVDGGIRPGSVENEMLILELGERTALAVDDEEVNGSPLLYAGLALEAGQEGAQRPPEPRSGAEDG